MARYLIVGAGKFGRLALQRLPAQDKEVRILIIDPKAEALAEARRVAAKEIETLEADAISYLASHLGPDFPWDWLIPMAPVHVAYLWLLAGPLAGQGWEAAQVPKSLENLAALAVRGPQGELYLSRATHLCPDDCAEPLVCPVTGEEREQPLYDKLREASCPELPVLVVASRQLAPGIGGYEPSRLLELAGRAADMSGPFLVATACRCHGVVHGLKRTGARGA